jgi:hypothetical protein
MCEPFMVLFPFDSPPKSVSKGARFGVFGVLGLEEFLAGFLRFLLIWHVLVFLLSPKSCANLWSDSGDRELDLGVLTRGCCSSREAQATPI